MTEFILVPGIGGSGEQHWQSLWQHAHASMRRFEPESWDHPRLGHWIESLNSAVRAASTPPVLVAHSLACLLVAHWSARSSLTAAGAFLVSVPDPAAADFPHLEAATFSPVPTVPLRFPTLMIASTDDPYGTLPYQRRRAAQWGARIVEIGKRGHINASSGLKDWPAGLALLDEFTKSSCPVCAGIG